MLLIMAICFILIEFVQNKKIIQQKFLSQIKSTILQPPISSSSGNFALPAVAAISLGKINTTSINIYSQVSATQIDIWLTYPGVHWLGIGFGKVMKGSDMIVFEIVNNAVVCSDRISTGHTAPMLDTSLGGTNDVKLVGYSIQSNVVTVHVSRNLNTKDINDFVITGPGNYDLIWGWSPSLTMTTHEGSGGSGKINVKLG